MIQICSLAMKLQTMRRCMILVMELQLSVPQTFFMPIVDDPFDFGRIAATNAISDILLWAVSRLWESLF